MIAQDPNDSKSSLRRLERVFFSCYSVCETMKDTKEG